jgi:hypothetical protein
VQYVKKGQIHISGGGGGLHQIQKSTHKQGSDVTQNWHYMYMRGGKTEWVWLIMGPAVTLSVFDLMRTISCHVLNYVLFTEAITHLLRTSLCECVKTSTWVAKTVLEKQHQETGMQKLIYLTTIQYVYVNMIYLTNRILIYQQKMLASNDIFLWSSPTNVYESVQKWFSLSLMQTERVRSTTRTSLRIVGASHRKFETRTSRTEFRNKIIWTFVSQGFTGEYWRSNIN